MKVTFLSSPKLAPHGTPKHRCYQPAEYLMRAGIEADVQWLFDLKLALDVDVVILSRAQMNPRTSRVIRQAKSYGTPVLYDIDDLLIDERIESYLVTIGQPARSGIVARRLSALRAADAVITSTLTLAEAVGQVEKPTYVLRNGLNNSYLQSAEEVYLAQRPPRQSLVLGYMSGSPTHDADFAQIAGTLAQLLRRYPHVNLLVVGPLTLPPVLKAFGERVEQKAFVPYADFPTQLAEIDINLAPLQIEESFCQAKSELKYVEAGACGIPTVATATRPFSWAIDNGKNGFLVKTEADWFRVLNLLVTQPELIRMTGEQAHAHVLRNYTPAVRATQWKAMIEQVARSYDNSDGREGSPTPTPANQIGEILFVLLYRLSLLAPANRLLRKAWMRFPSSL